MIRPYIQLQDCFTSLFKDRLLSAILNGPYCIGHTFQFVVSYKLQLLPDFRMIWADFCFSSSHFSLFKTDGGLTGEC